MFTCGNPILLGVWVDLEDVGPCTEDGLLSAEREERRRRGKEGEMERSVRGYIVGFPWSSCLKYAVCN